MKRIKNSDVINISVGQMVVLTDRDRLPNMMQCRIVSKPEYVGAKISLDVEFFTQAFSRDGGEHIKFVKQVYGIELNPELRDVYVSEVAGVLDPSTQELGNWILTP